MAENYIGALGLAPARKDDPRFKSLRKLTEIIIGCAIEVHRQLGPGLLEGTYEAALCIELEDAGLRFVRQPTFPAVYEGQSIGEYRLDLIVENLVVIEIKSVELFDPVFEAQVLTYLRVTGKKIGLIVNFNSRAARRNQAIRARLVVTYCDAFSVSLRLCG